MVREKVGHTYRRRGLGDSAQKGFKACTEDTGEPGRGTRRRNEMIRMTSSVLMPGSVVSARKREENKKADDGVEGQEEENKEKD